MVLADRQLLLTAMRQECVRRNHLAYCKAWEPENYTSIMGLLTCNTGYYNIISDLQTFRTFQAFAAVRSPLYGENPIVKWSSEEA